MASYGIAINLPIPTSGQAAWDGPLLNLLQAIINVLAQRVTPTGMLINSNLDLGGNQLVDVASLQFIPATSDPGVANSVFVAGTGAGLVTGEWYIRDGSNRLIQLTSGGALNISVNGGFGGQYVSAGAVASYNAGNNTYYFTTNGTTPATINAATGSFSGLNISSLTTPSGYGLLVSNATGTLSLIQSGTVVQWVDVTTGVSPDTATYATNSGWVLGAAGASVDVPLSYNQGDQLQSIVYTTQGVATTASLNARTVQAGGSIITQTIAKKLSQGVAAVSMSNDIYTTGTLPFLTNPSSSLYLRFVNGGRGSEALQTIQVTWLRKMI